ncbi:MAG: PP0621 family protein [Gammaproteobacteria bacterium]|nr:PP0621 family protein [Gammaproteobacteria bacterium]MDH5659653.1 PP0621 family protein [Gammaproteobacteria bacterium]
MSLIRLIVIALIIYLVIQIFKRWAANKNTQRSVHQENTQKMVQCEICQLHIPENEALQRDGEFFCSQEHLEVKKD